MNRQIAQGIWHSRKAIDQLLPGAAFAGDVNHLELGMGRAQAQRFAAAVAADADDADFCSLHGEAFEWIAVNATRTLEICTQIAARHLSRTGRDDRRLLREGGGRGCLLSKLSKVRPPATQS